MAKKKIKKEAGPKVANKMSGVERLAALEDTISRQNGKLEFLAGEIDKIATSVGILAKRLKATIDATESENKVDELILNENIRELEGKTTMLVDQGVIVRDKAHTVDNRTFIVARDHNNGEVVNPRIQFSTSSIDEKFLKQLEGKKEGDFVTFEGTESELELVEVYRISDPKDTEQNFEEEATEAVDNTEETSEASE